MARLSGPGGMARLSRARGMARASRAGAPEARGITSSSPLAATAVQRSRERTKTKPRAMTPGRTRPPSRIAAITASLKKGLHFARRSTAHERVEGPSARPAWCPRTHVTRPNRTTCRSIAPAQVMEHEGGLGIHRGRWGWRPRTGTWDWDGFAGGGGYLQSHSGVYPSRWRYLRCNTGHGLAPRTVGNPWDAGEENPHDSTSPNTGNEAHHRCVTVELPNGREARDSSGLTQRPAGCPPGTGGADRRYGHQGTPSRGPSS